STIGKDEVCGGELDEITLDPPPKDDPDSEDCPEGKEKDEFDNCVNIIDPIDPENPENSEGECDEFEFDCDTDNGGGGTGDDPVDEDCDTGQTKNEDGICVDDCDTSKDDLKKVFPNTADVKLTEIADAINKYAHDFGIDTKEKLQHFIAQAGHESTKFTAFEENLNYRWEKLGEKKYWEKYFNPVSTPTKDSNKANPNDYKRSSTSVYVDKEKFANLVYGGRMGNNSTEDGYKYRGRGVFQLTGKYNYEQFNIFYQENHDNNKDLTTNPDLITTDMKIAVISALWFYKKNVNDKITIDTNTTVEEVTKKVNGGTKGLDDRESLHTKAKTNIDCL
ncbi:MAG: glycoside hydrolase family 19 protein, partial [Bacteroidota bacterium]